MSVTYGFFNSVNNDRLYNADQMSEYFEGLISDGIYENVGGALQVLAGSGMTVNIQTGRMIINSKWLKNDAVLPIQITAADVLLNRYTAIVARLDRTNRIIEIIAKDGTPATVPTKPEIINNSSYTEKCLAYIYVAKGATAISQSNIEDTRANTNVCGWVTGVIKQVDTSTLFLQWQTAYEEQYAIFESWFASLTEELHVNTYIQKFEKSVTLSAATTIKLDMEDYTYDSYDIINVYINGLHGVAGVDYTLTVSEGSASVTPVAAASGTDVYIEVLKSVIGQTSV